MSTLTQSASFAANTGRPLAVRMRRDLVARRQQYQGRSYWVLKDPLNLKYFRLEEEEFELLKLLDGQRSLEAIQRAFEKQFAPQKITHQELQRYIGMLHGQGLVTSDVPGQGKQFQEKQAKRISRERKAAIANILAFRMRGFDPDRLLGWLNKYAGWLFSVPAMIVCLLLAASAGLLVAVEFDVFRSRLPNFDQFFGPGNWLWLALVLSVTKVLHEIGHGLSCKRMGGECHEMGVMLLVLTPCLYCNVSDSWLLPSKWKRAAIGAAGMYVELILASIATFLWWFSEPGLFNSLCLNVMFVCSVSTLLFNSNPLLRYDGYYILSDLVEIPNLRQKATSVLKRFLSSQVLGLPPAADPFLPKKNQGLFAAYAVAAAIYRWVVTLSILWFLNRVFEPYGLQRVGQLIACASLYGLVVHPLVSFVKFLKIPGRIGRVKKLRVAATGLAVVLLLLAVLFLPLPYYVHCGLEIKAQDAKAAYVDLPGTLQEVYVQPGDIVAAGQPLAKLMNIDDQLELARLEGEYQRLAAQLESVHRRAVRDPTAQSEMQQVSQAALAAKKQWQRRKEESKKLLLTAPVPGVVISPQRQPQDDASAEEEGLLRSWSGSPLDYENRGAYLESGVVFCLIADPRKLEAVLAIDQSDIEFVQPGQQVELMLDPAPGEVRSGVIRQIASSLMQDAPASLSIKSGGEIATVTDASGRIRPLNATYQASTPIEEPDARIAVGSTGLAKVAAGKMTLGLRLWRYLCKTFQFEA